MALAAETDFACIASGFCLDLAYSGMTCLPTSGSEHLLPWVTGTTGAIFAIDGEEEVLHFIR